MDPDLERKQATRLSQKLTAAYRAGDLAAVKAALGWPEAFPNTPQPMAFGCGDWPLVAAINLSPLRFVRRLLSLGADPNYEALGGFPSLFVAIDSGRPDLVELVSLLLVAGARVDQRGLNDWTPLHHAVARRNLAVIRLLVLHGADPLARTRIDDRTDALEDAIAAGFEEAVEALRGAGEPARPPPRRRRQS